MGDVVIRSAKDTDDSLAIASCIYLTDPFIYPAAFGRDVQRASYAISKLMEIANGLFNPENIVLALYNDVICGILLYNKGGIVWDDRTNAELIREIVPSYENFNYVSKEYFAIESAAPMNYHIEVIACCVLPGYRSMGIGKNLLRWLIEKYSDHVLTLDVLANNPAAISLYKKCGFQIVESLKGFSLDESNRPDCFRMKRIST